MTTQPLLIADFKGGLQKDLQEWLLPRDAFPSLENAYLFRGVLRKKGGSRLLGSTNENSRVKDYTGTVAGGPIIGLMQRELESVNKEQLIAFGAGTGASSNNGYVNYFDPTTSNFIFNVNAPVWTIDERTYMWGKNYFGSLWVSTNGLINPIIYTFDPAAVTPWYTLNPVLRPGITLSRALLVIPYKNRLVILNTVEQGVIYRQRARWSQNGTPYVANAPPNIGTDVNAWRDDIVGKGGYIDAPTQEQIISCEFHKDTLIVFFERSTWQLRYTGNEALPFVWDRVNAEKGAEATWSTVKLEQGAACVGFNGIMLSDGVNTERIDQKIPNLVFSMANEEDIPKIHGVRDYWAQAVYWTYVSPKNDQNNSPTFPDRMLYYNYRENTWAIFKNSYTTFGNYTSLTDRAWQDFTEIPKDEWRNLASSWVDPHNILGFPVVIAGNQQGFVHKLLNAGPNNTQVQEAVSLECSVTASPTVNCTNHNLSTGDFVQVRDSSTTSDLQIFKVVKLSKDTFEAQPCPPEPPKPAIQNFSTGYLSKVHNFDITSKRINPLIEGGAVGRIPYLDVFVSNPEISSIDQFQVRLEVDNSTEIVKTLVVSPTTTEDKIWKRIFFNSVGNFFTTRFNFSDEQMYTPDTAFSDVRIHAMMFHIRSAGGRLTK